MWKLLCIIHKGTRTIGLTLVHENVGKYLKLTTLVGWPHVVFLSLVIGFKSVIAIPISLCTNLCQMDKDNRHDNIGCSTITNIISWLREMIVVVYDTLWQIMRYKNNWLLVSKIMNLILDGNKTSYFFGFARFAYLPNTVNQQILECYYIWRIWRIAYIR